MKLIALLIVLGLERYAGFSLVGYFSQWFKQYYQLVNRMARIKTLNSAILQLIIVMVPLLLITLLLQSLLIEFWFGLLGFVFSVAVLLLCLRSEHYQEKWRDYLNALSMGDTEQAVKAGNQAIADGATHNADELSQIVEAKVLVDSNDHLFSVIFWFMIFGPVGAILYRACCWLHETGVVTEGLSKLGELCRRVLAWIPARLCALSYALVGQFIDSFAILQQYAWSFNRSSEASESTESVATLFQGNDELLHYSGLAALGNNKDSKTGEPLAAVSMVNRSLVVWLVVIALITILN